MPPGKRAWFAEVSEMEKVSPTAQLLPPRYEVVKELGRGGMAVVYHAFDTTSKRHVAIKFLPPTDDENALKRFRREAADLVIFDSESPAPESLAACGAVETEPSTSR